MNKKAKTFIDPFMGIVWFWMLMTKDMELVKNSADFT